MTNNSYILLRRYVNRISKYSLAYHIVVILILIFAQLDVFKKNVPIEFIVDLVIVFSSVIIFNSILDKILQRNKQDSKPFLYCPECSNAKMRTTGKWTCEKCQKEFSDPKKESDNS